EIGNDALVRGLVPAPLSLARLVLDPEWIAVVAVEDDLPLFHRELAERLIHRDLVAARHRLDQVVVEIGGAAQGTDRAFAEWPGLVRNDEGGIDLELAAQPSTRRTGAVRVVKRKVSWRGLFHREAVVGTGKVLAEEQLLP